MGSKREERFLMRQRGAGTHKIKDVSFALEVPLPANDPLPPQRSSRARRTPQPDQQPLKPQRSSRRTPQVQQQALPPTRSSRRTPGRSIEERPSPFDRPTEEAETLGTSSQPRPSNSDLSISKKRKLQGGLQGPATVPRPSTLSQPPSSATRSHNNVPATGSTPQKKVQPQLKWKATPSTTPLLASLRKQSKVDESTSREEYSKAAIITKSGLRRTSPRNAQSQIQAVEREPTKHLAKKALVGRKPEKTKVDAATSQDVKEVEDNEHSVNGKRKHEGDKQKPKKRKRKSFTHIKRRSLPEDHNEDEEYEAEAVDAEAPSPKTRKFVAAKQVRSTGKGAKVPSTVPEEQQEELTDAEEEETSAEEEGENVQRSVTDTGIRGRQSKAAAKTNIQETQAFSKAFGNASRASLKSIQPKSKASARASKTVPSKSRIKPTRSSPRNTVPITVHRLSKLHLPTIDEGGEEESISAPALPKRGGVNAVDVLSQICKELIAQSVQTMRDDVGNAVSTKEKGKLKRKIKVVEAFGMELDARLFEMTDAVDNNYSLSTRVRQANKEKVVLREELLEVRREREKIALKMDEVRRVHRKESIDTQSRNDLNTAMHDIELAIHRGRMQQEAQRQHQTTEITTEPRTVGLEASIRNVGIGVSSNREGGGLLMRVKELNGFLEKVAGALDRRV
ncbi:MAG: hypothetical protein M1827_002002 [Pycnora praestabilis]|nr:MAG: hypothetical protein M1827_002002 [Pycnora praestabilis]